MDTALTKLAESGQLDVPVRPVVLDATEPQAPGGGAGVQILWRRGRDVTRGWICKAVDTLPDLSWLHSDYVGIDQLPTDQLTRRGVIVTNGLGNYSRPMAEWIVLSMLAAAKRLPHFVRQSDAGIWDPTPELAELEGATALFLGLGSVGTMAAPMVAALGVEVLGVARRSRPAPPPGVARLVPPESWREQLPLADFVVCALPLTKETRGMIDAAALAIMKPTAWLVNVARGALIDEAALVESLDAGTIGGAVLDVFDKEPLPSGHPLWGRPNVLVVPHHTWASPRVRPREDALFATQLRSWMSGRTLANQVDMKAGY